MWDLVSVRERFLILTNDRFYLYVILAIELTLRKYSALEQGIVKIAMIRHLNALCHLDHIFFKQRNSYNIEVRSHLINHNSDAENGVIMKHRDFFFFILQD